MSRDLIGRLLSPGVTNISWLLWLFLKAVWLTGSLNMSVKVLFYVAALLQLYPQVALVEGIEAWALEAQMFWDILALVLYWPGLI